MPIKVCITEPIRNPYEQLKALVHGNGWFSNRFSLYAPRICVVDGLERTLFRHYRFNSEYTILDETPHVVEDHAKAIKDGRRRVLRELLVDNDDFTDMRNSLRRHTQIQRGKGKIEREAEHSLEYMLDLGSPVKTVDVKREYVKSAELERFR